MEAGVDFPVHLSREAGGMVSNNIRVSVKIECVGCLIACLIDCVYVCMLVCLYLDKFV